MLCVPLGADFALNPGSPDTALGDPSGFAEGLGDDGCIQNLHLGHGRLHDGCRRPLLRPSTRHGNPVHTLTLGALQGQAVPKLRLMRVPAVAGVA
jgi:hypothetical protein